MHARRILAALALTASFAGAALAQSAQAPAQAPAGAPAAPIAAKPQAAPALAPPAVTATTPAAQLVDINAADKATREKLKGVGPARAEAIIKGRPFKGKDELVQRNILPKDVYDGVKDQVIARQKS